MDPAAAETTQFSSDGRRRALRSSWAISTSLSRRQPKRPAPWLPVRATVRCVVALEVTRPRMGVCCLTLLPEAPRNTSTYPPLQYYPLPRPGTPPPATSFLARSAAHSFLKKKPVDGGAASCMRTWLGTCTWHSGHCACEMCVSRDVTTQRFILHGRAHRVAALRARRLDQGAGRGAAAPAGRGFTPLFTPY